MQFIITHIQDLQSARYYNSFENIVLAFSVDALSPQGMSVANIKAITSWLHDPYIGLYALDYHEREELIFLAQEIGAQTIICNNLQAEGMLFPHIILLEGKSVINKSNFTQALMAKDLAEIQDFDLPFFLQYSKDGISNINLQAVGYYADASEQDMFDEEWINFLEKEINS